MRKSISKRIKITKRGRVRRRTGGLGHSRANKRTKQLLRKKRNRGLEAPAKIIHKHLQ